MSDNYRLSGGLAGVEAAMADNRDVVVVAWDMPFVAGSLLLELVRVGREGQADAALPQSNSPYGLEPFCGFYAHRIRPLLRGFLQAGGGPAHEFVESLPRLAIMPAVAVARHGDPARLFFSVNTPADLEQARAMIAAAP